jgi:NAD(P)-dependent dehydrogenase (short-subunit alcohol dehydrogenase family)
MQRLMSASPASNVLVQGASRGLGLAFVRTLLEREGVRRVFASARAPERSPGLAALRERYAERLHLIRLDVRDEASIETAARLVRETSPHLHLLLNVAGILHDAEGLRPEKRLGDVDPKLLRRAFEVNAFGPLLVAKHFASCLRHDERAVLVNVSARVGSIGDNRLGGWYAYRASKAAQNMFTRTLSIELARRAPNVCCVALHAGTVDTAMSKAKQGGAE